MLLTKVTNKTDHNTQLQEKEMESIKAPEQSKLKHKAALITFISSINIKLQRIAHGRLHFMPLVKVSTNSFCSVMWYSSAVHRSYFPVALQICKQGTMKIYTSDVPKDRCLPTGDPESVMAKFSLGGNSAPGKLSAPCPGFP
jgi:hypothetical protein